MRKFGDRIVLGHNSFFGVDHLSAKRGNDRLMAFSNPRKIVDVIQFAMEKGVGGMMLSTHPSAPEVVRLIQADSVTKSLRIYPLLPYVQKYVTAANEKGILNVLSDILFTSTASDQLSLLWKGAKSVIGKDIMSMLSGLITAELRIFKKCEIPSVFLHDAFTDIILALDLKEIAHFFHEEMFRAFKTEAAFATKNLPLLIDKFSAWGFPTPLVMAHVNQIGFNMNPCQRDCEEALETNQPHVMAMNTLAGGYLPPSVAYPYLARFRAIESVVIGASSHKHLEETVWQIERAFGR